MRVYLPATTDRLARWDAAGVVEAGERAFAATAALRSAVGLPAEAPGDDEADDEDAADAALTQAARASVELLAEERLDGLRPLPRRVVVVAEVPGTGVRAVDDDDGTAAGEVRLDAPVLRDGWAAVHADVDDADRDGGDGDGEEGPSTAALVAAAVEGLADDDVDADEALRRAEAVDEVELGWHDVGEVGALVR